MKLWKNKEESLSLMESMSKHVVYTPMLLVHVMNTIDHKHILISNASKRDMTWYRLKKLYNYRQKLLEYMNTYVIQAPYQENSFRLFIVHFLDDIILDLENKSKRFREI